MSTVQRPRHDRTGGFTLTELLVVISIIAILVGLTSVAVVRAINTARQTGQKSEIDQLDLAMKAYKEQFGSYPPCNLRPAGVHLARLKQHFAQRFPRYYNLNNLDQDLLAAGVDPVNFRPDQAIVFWLSAFNADPTHPLFDYEGFIIEGGGRKVPNEKVITKTPPLFEFDTSRLGRVPNPTATGLAANELSAIPSYFPKGSRVDDTGAPYVYFDAGFYAMEPLVLMGSLKRNMFNHSDPSVSVVPTFVNAGTLQQYAFVPNKERPFDPSIDGWANPETFQIIGPGMDFKYGDPNMDGASPLRVYPRGDGYDTSNNRLDDDNVTNFSSSARIGDERP